MACYYKKLADIKRKKAKCYSLDHKKNGKYTFDGWILLSEQRFKAELNKALDNLSQ